MGYKLSLLCPFYFALLSCQFAQMSFAGLLIYPTFENQEFPFIQYKCLTCRIVYLTLVLNLTKTPDNLLQDFKILIFLSETTGPTEAIWVRMFIGWSSRKVFLID